MPSLNGRPAAVTITWLTAEDALQSLSWACSWEESLPLGPVSEVLTHTRHSQALVIDGVAVARPASHPPLHHDGARADRSCTVSKAITSFARNKSSTSRAGISCEWQTTGGAEGRSAANNFYKTWLITLSATLAVDVFHLVVMKKDGFGFR